MGVHRSDETILSNTHHNGHHKDFPTELLNVLHRNPKNIYKSELLRIDLAEEFSTKDFLLSEDIMYEGDKVKILQKVKSQRQHVEEAMTKLKDEESVQNFTQYDVERQLMDNTTEKQFSKYSVELYCLSPISWPVKQVLYIA